MYGDRRRAVWIDGDRVTVIEFTHTTTPPLGWGDYLDQIEIKKAGGK